MHVLVMWGYMYMCHWCISTSRYDELRNVVHAMKNSQKIKDIAKVQSGIQVQIYIHVYAKGAITE